MFCFIEYILFLQFLRWISSFVNLQKICLNANSLIIFLPAHFSLCKFVCLICQLLQSYGQFVLVELIMQWVKFAMSQIFNARNVQWAKYSMSVLLVWPWWYQSQYATREHFWAEVPEKSFGTYVQYLSLELQWRPLRMDLEAYLTIQYRSYLDKTAEYIEHFLLHIYLFSKSIEKKFIPVKRKNKKNLFLCTWKTCLKRDWASSRENLTDREGQPACTYTSHLPGTWASYIY
mgnify:CR=1 FL=1